VAVVSYGFWRARLGGMADPTGRSLTLDGERYAIIGVLPEGFRLRGLTGLTTQTPDVWVPAGLFGDADDRGWHLYEGIGRLRRGVSPAQAASDIAPLLRGGRTPASMGVRVLPRQREEAASARGPLLVLLAAAVLLMAIAAVNVATLFTAEAARRRHEFATRQALGASRWRLARQLAFESGSIGLLGALIGAAVAIVGVPALLALSPPELGLPARIPLDLRILSAAAAFGIAVGIVFGVVPSLLVSRATSKAALTARSVTTDRATARVQRALIAAEAALSIVLLIGAGLLGRTLLALQAADPGFQRQDLIAVSLPLSGPQTQPHLVVQLARDLVDRLGALPGVAAVTGANAVPFSGEGGSSSFDIEGRESGPNQKKPEAHRRNVLPGFHETLGIAVVAGRTFRAEDREDSRPVVVVSESLAERYWPGQSPIGGFILRDGFSLRDEVETRWEIVGVVRDILHEDLTAAGQSTFYFPFYQQPPTRFWLIVRSALPAAQLMPAIRTAVTAAAPGVALGRVDALGRLVDASTATARYRAALVAVFGGCSLLLAAVGIFGVTARMVSARRRELGIRLVLGAREAEITRAVVTAEARAIGTGIVVGVVLSAVAVRALEGFLFGVSPYDARTFVVAALVLGAVGLVASYLPARRASRANPLEVLRAE
jgi:putative ABC transport system permease protein